MTKRDSLFSDLKKAYKRLKEAVSLPPTIIHQDATIQRFEFCFELSWKLMQTILQENGIEAYGPRNSIREAAKLGLISDPKLWLEFLKARNLTVHTYEEKLARQIYQKAKKFLSSLEELLQKSKNLSLSPDLSREKRPKKIKI